MAANGPGWKIEWVKFTKADAQQALAKFKEDRGVDAAWVDALSRTMDAGLWEVYSPSQTPIAFDRGGNRLNGKHRLLAFIKSKLDEIIFPVVRNLDPDEFRNFDQNVKLRKHTNAHPGHINLFRDEARVGWLEVIVSADKSVKMTTQLFDHLCGGKWKRQVRWATDKLQSQSRQGKAPYAAAFMYVHRLDPVFADKVVEMWRDGPDGSKHPHLRRIRDRAMSVTKNGHGGRGEREVDMLRLLGVLAYMHQDRPLPNRLSNILVGIRYFSEKLRDGAAARWEKRTIVGADEV